MLRQIANAVAIAGFAGLLLGFVFVEWHISSLPPRNQRESQQSDKHPAKKTQQIIETERADYRIARYTLWLAILTGALVVASCIQGYFLLRADKTARISAYAARDAANASSVAAEASIRQAKIAETALVQLERPYIFIFGVRGIKQDSETQEFFVEYTVANYGKMPAIIEAPHIGFDISESGEPPLPTLMFDGHSLRTSPILQAGEERRKIREYFPANMVGEDIVVQIDRVVKIGAANTDEPSGEVVPTFNVPDGFAIFFRAVIRYRGPFTSCHETEALWLYNPGSFEFAVRGGNEGNYIK
jgi:hypothetical protein